MGYGWWRSLIGFDLRLRGDEIGKASCHGSSGQNCRNSKAQSDHLLAFLRITPMVPSASGTVAQNHQ